jgi:hypothetical protein
MSSQIVAKKPTSKAASLAVMRGQLSLPACDGWHTAQPRPQQKSALGVRRDNAALSSGCKPHPVTLQPEATGAVMEVTKWLKPSDSGLRIGNRASVQAATRVSAPGDRQGVCGESPLR